MGGISACMHTNHLWHSIPPEGASSDRVFEGCYPLIHPHHRHHQILSGLFEDTQHKKHRGFSGNQTKVSLKSEKAWLSLLSKPLLPPTHNPVPVTSQFQGIVVRIQAEAQQRWTAATPQWSYGGLPRSEWSPAGPHRSSPLVSWQTKSQVTWCWTLLHLHA